MTNTFIGSRADVRIDHNANGKSRGWGKHSARMFEQISSPWKLYEKSIHRVMKIAVYNPTAVNTYLDNARMEDLNYYLNLMDFMPLIQ